MPRCCSISIQSEVAERRSPRAFTAPAPPVQRAAVEQELLGERRLAGVGVGDDGERSPAGGLGDGVGHDVLALSDARLRSAFPRSSTEISPDVRAATVPSALSRTK